jgi:hypothetical protein
MSRGTVSGNGIVTDGLVLALDAANPKSYASGSSVWRDLTVNNITGSLINGPIFSGANGGSIVFDGVDDYVNLPSTALNFVNIPITLSSWAKVNNLGTEGGTNIFFGKDRSSSDNAYTQFSVNDQNKLRLLLQNGTLSNDFVGNGSDITKNISHFSVTVTSQFITFYLNGSQYGDVITNTNGVLPNYPTPNSEPWTINRLNARIFGDFYGSTTIYISSMYNRALSASEILQNYNATKTRFGL